MLRRPDRLTFLRTLGALHALTASAIASATPDWRAIWDTTENRGWLEAVVIVADAAPLRRFAREVAGWRELDRSPLPAPWKQFYGASARDRAARTWLIGDATGRPGLLRLVQLDAAGAGVIRAGAMPWDTGGFLSLMTRSNRTAQVYDAAQRLGWNAFNDPVELRLVEPPVRLTNVVLRGPESICISVYERLEPRLPDEPDLRRLRRPFNAMQSVRDLHAARRFYVDVLGFTAISEGEFFNSIRAPNNFGTPANLVVAQPLGFAILGPHRDGPTQVEIVQMRGVEGRDLAHRAVPPNRGLLGLRFPVRDLRAVQQRLVARQWPIERAPTDLTLPPWGRVRVLAVRSPDGAWLEFLEKIDR
ncbi:MAG: VOC family protein [Steroidobacteraceae bacterium]|nr:VOC family protein [Steroidobacteraceae bacterium]MDW8260639.1 VOC family protein [Gammaproteobacteria bacterium]